MDDFSESVFIEEILIKIQFAKLQFNVIDEEIIKLDQKQCDIERMFVHIYGALNFISNISQVLFPSEKKSLDRAKHLRSSLAIDEESFLANRTVRNHLSHIDERIDRWRKNSRRRIMMRMTITSPSNSISEIASTDIFEQYIHPTNVLIFLGDEYNLNKAKNELAVLEEKAIKTEKSIESKFVFYLM